MDPLRALRIAGMGLAVSMGVALAQEAAAAPAHEAHELVMETHAKFFSDETHQPKALDPQVFVQDAGAKAGTGPQNIQHQSGLRPAFLADAPTQPLFTAKGRALAFTLGDWLGAKGTAAIAADGHTVSLTFSGLRPKGTYSLFENHFDQQPIGFTPLDGAGTANTFVAQADGKAHLTVKVPGTLSHENAILLVYHSDHAAHGTSRGEIGVNAHHQLIARIP